MTDPLCDFEEVKSCGVAIFQLFAENKVLCEQAVYPRFDFHTFSAENFLPSFQALTSEYLECYSDEDLVEVYGRLLYTFHNKLTVRTHLPAKEVFLWLLNARGFSPANLTPAQIMDRATQSTPLYSEDFSTIHQALFHFLKTWKQFHETPTPTGSQRAQLEPTITPFVSTGPLRQLVVDDSLICSLTAATIPRTSFERDIKRGLINDFEHFENRHEKETETIVLNVKEEIDVVSANFNRRFQTISQQMNRLENNQQAITALKSLLQQLVSRLDRMEDQQMHQTYSSVLPPTPQYQPSLDRSFQATAPGDSTMALHTDFSRFVSSDIPPARAGPTSHPVPESFLYDDNDTLTVDSITTSVGSVHTPPSPRSRYAPPAESPESNYMMFSQVLSSTVRGLDKSITDALPTALFGNRVELDKYVQQFKLYKQKLGTTTLLQALQTPPNPRVPLDTNYNSWCFDMPVQFIEDSEVLAYLDNIWPASASQSLSAKLLLLKMKPTSRIDIAAIGEYSRKFAVLITANRSEYEAMGPTRDSAIIRIFIKGMQPDGNTVLTSWNINSLDTWSSLRAQIIAHVSNSERYQSMNTLPSSSTGQTSTSSAVTNPNSKCTNCTKVGHLVAECRQPCTKPVCTAAHRTVLGTNPTAKIHSGKNCPKSATFRSGCTDFSGYP